MSWIDDARDAESKLRLSDDEFWEWVKPYWGEVVHQLKEDFHEWDQKECGRYSGFQLNLGRHRKIYLDEDAAPGSSTDKRSRVRLEADAENKGLRLTVDGRVETLGTGYWDKSLRPAEYFEVSPQRLSQRMLQPILFPRLASSPIPTLLFRSQSGGSS